MNEIMTAAAFLAGSFLGAIIMLLQIKETYKMREEIKDREIARLKKELEEQDPWVPTYTEFIKISEHEVEKAKKNQEVDFNGNF